MDIRDKIKNIERYLEKLSCCINNTTSNNTIGASCTTPSNVVLCELQQILDALNAIKIQINGDDIDINLNLNQLEQLVSDLATQLTQPNTNHVIVDNFAGAVEYNNVKQEEATFNNNITVPSNSIHSISYKILSGVVDITIGADTLSYEAGEADMEEVTTLIQQQYIFTPQLGGKVKIKTIK